MQMHFSILAYDDVKCSKCHQFRKWNEGKGWHGYHCPVCELEYQRQYRTDNSDAIRERNRQYRADNPESEKERQRRWYAANANAVRERSRQYRAENAGAIREYNRQYHANNAEDTRKRSRARRARKANAICKHGPGCFDQAAQSMPQRCSVPGCDNTDIEADHIIPLAKGGLDCRDNLQLLCKHHNASKNAGDPIAFRRRLGMLL